MRFFSFFRFSFLYSQHIYQKTLLLLNSTIHTIHAPSPIYIPVMWVTLQTTEKKSSNLRAITPRNHLVWLSKWGVLEWMMWVKVHFIDWIIKEFLFFLDNGGIFTGWTVSMWRIWSRATHSIFCFHMATNFRMFYLWLPFKNS